MTRAGRGQLIRRIGRARKSNVITYVTTTRPGMEVQMAMDAVRYIYDHLEALRREHGDDLKIDLYLYSNGGDGTVPWRLVTLIREYAGNFSVLVPFRAFSAATLTALGADTIVMHRMGMLGPTDATVANPFNPIDPANAGKRLGISVEDVTAFIALVKEDAGIQHEDQVVTAFNLLADKVHPLALGNVKRSISQSRLMAKKLLSLHMDPADKAHKVATIVDNLTSKLFFHGHPINRMEAKEQLGLENVEAPTDAVERAMWQLYLEYEREMLLGTPFNAPAEYLVDFPAGNVGEFNQTQAKQAKLVYVESESHCDLCRMEYQIVGQKQPNLATNVTLIQNSHGWIRET